MKEDGKRLITLLGLAGIGKSAVARDALHYVMERRYFRGGVIHIDLDHIKSYKIFENKLKSLLIKSLNLRAGNSTYHKLKKSYDSEFLELLEEFFVQKNEEFKLQNKTINYEY